MSQRRRAGSKRALRIVRIGGALRVLHLITDLDVGGAETLLCSLLVELDRDRFRPVVGFLRGESPLRHKLNEARIPFHRFPGRTPFDSSRIDDVTRFLETERISILHTHLPRAHWVGALAIRRLRGKGRPAPALIQTRHNTKHFRGLRRGMIPVDRFLAREADKIVPVSRSVRDEVARLTRLPAHRFEVVPNGIDLQSFAIGTDQRERVRRCLRERLSIGADEPLLLCVGSFTDQKGHCTLLEAISALEPHEPAVRLLLVGEGPLEHRLRSKTRELGIESRVIFGGVRDDVPSLLHASDLYLQPSYWEGFGLATLEAMASGTPVIASRVDGLAELIQEGVTGRLVLPKSATDLADVIDEVIREPAKATEMGQRGADRVREQYSIGETAKRIEAIYREVTSPDHPG